MIDQCLFIGSSFYINEIDASRNAIIVGSKQEVYSRALVASQLNWIEIDGLRQPLRVRTKIRYLHREADAVVTPVSDDQVRVEFSQPQLAITPGQAAVFYQGDSVIGGGVIECVLK